MDAPAALLTTPSLKTTISAVPNTRQANRRPDCASKLGLAPRRPLRITGVPTGWDIVGQGDLLEET